LAITLTVNGKKHTVSAEPETALLYVLRNDLKLKGARFGCGLGQCGACTVLSERKAVVSCAQPASRFDGRGVTTQEGLSEEQRRQWADCFLASGASQCGFCSPGIVMKAESLLAREAEPSRDAINRALAGNLCRCTGYDGIIRAVRRAAAEATDVG